MIHQLYVHFNAFFKGNANFSKTVVAGHIFVKRIHGPLKFKVPSYCLKAFGH